VHCPGLVCKGSRGELLNSSFRGSFNWALGKTGHLADFWSDGFFKRKPWDTISRLQLVCNPSLEVSMGQMLDVNSETSKEYGN
jgi:hypothetical protein